MKVAAVDVAPSGFTTVTLAAPIELIKDAETGAVNRVALPKLVDSAAPSHSTAAPETKFAPFTVSVNDAVPATADKGLRLEIAGAEDAAGVTWKLWLTGGAAA